MANEGHSLSGGGRHKVSNDFLDITKAGMDRECPPRLYALAEGSEATGSSQVVQWSAVDADWFDSNVLSKDFRDEAVQREALGRARLWVLGLSLPPSGDHGTYAFSLSPAGMPVVSASTRDAEPVSVALPSKRLRSWWRLPPRRTPRDTLIESMRRGWWEIELDPRPGFSAFGADLFPNLFAEGRQVSVIDMRPVTNAERRVALSHGNPMRRVRATPTDQVGALLDARLGGASPTMVGIYDVGQGSCAGLLVSGSPRLYVDFGGGVLGNARTFPPALTSFCFAADPVIVLSHWDWDHWSSAYRDPRALAKTWIVPRQSPVGHVHRAFMLDVPENGGRLVVWPRGGRLDRNALRIEACTGSTRNGSGLALVVHPPEGRPGNSILLPGDADLANIPSVQARTPFDSIVSRTMAAACRGAVRHPAQVIPTPGWPTRSERVTLTTTCFESPGPVTRPSDGSGGRTRREGKTSSARPRTDQMASWGTSASAGIRRVLPTMSPRAVAVVNCGSGSSDRDRETRSDAEKRRDGPPPGRLGTRRERRDVMDLTGVTCRVTGYLGPVTRGGRKALSNPNRDFSDACRRLSEPVRTWAGPPR